MSVVESKSKDPIGILVNFATYPHPTIERRRMGRMVVMGVRVGDNLGYTLASVFVRF